MLLLHKDDVKNIRRHDKQTIQAMNDNMNRLAEVLAQKNIKLYFMPVVDKYNLYRTFIINNPYPESVFFEEMRLLPKKYEYIDTKKILFNALQRGEKDIFYPDDTHWSWRAPEMIFEQVRIQP